jgi:hypothetical protein
MKNKDLIILIAIGYLAYKTIQKPQNNTIDLNSIIYALTVPGSGSGGGGGGAR